MVSSSIAILAARTARSSRTPASRLARGRNNLGRTARGGEIGLAICASNQEPNSATWVLLAV
jgi:hypothetical protein